MLKEKREYRHVQLSPAALTIEQLIERHEMLAAQQRQFVQRYKIIAKERKQQTQAQWIQRISAHG